MVKSAKSEEEQEKADEEFNAWEVIQRFGQEPAPYDPEAAQRVKELFDQVGPTIREQFPTIEAFMNSLRGRGNYDPD